MKVLRGLGAILMVAVLAGCAGGSQKGEFEFGNLQLKRSFEDAMGYTYDLTRPALHDTEGVYDMKATGTAFQRRLHAEYVNLADKEQAEGEGADARRFLQRAAASAKGEKVMPEDASTRYLVPRVAANMRRERDRLVGMLYRLDGVNREPGIAAHAQAMFDCWQEEAEEGDEEGIAECRDAYKQDMKDLRPRKLAGLVVLLPNEDGGVGKVNVKCGDGTVQLNKAGQTSQIYAGKDSACEPTAMSKGDIENNFGKTLAALPAAVARYILLFKTDTTNLENESIAEKDRLMSDVATRPVAEVTVEGHTDRVGSIEYNEKLSRRRAEYVRKALIAAGVSPDNISSNWHGENTPAVDTSDDTPEAANRRVEVTIR